MQKQIESVEYFACGYCENYLHYLFRKAPKQKLYFPAGVYLIKHRKFGYILYDTGYGVELKQRKLKYWLYHLANPFFITAEQEIAGQLRRRGIAPEEVRYVILSHLHPDHIGGVKSFPNAELIVTKDLYRQLNRYRLRDLVFQEVLPRDFRARLSPVTPNTMDRRIHTMAEDLFKDGSLLIASLDGHATGQACVFLPEYHLFIAADVCWGMELLRYASQIRKLPLLIQKNPKAYFKNIRLLKKIQQDGIKVVVSHDPPKRVHRILSAISSKSNKDNNGFAVAERKI